MSAIATTTKIETWKWAVVWAMFAATMLNYMDRQTMASTAVAIKTEFNLNKEGYGKIEFWFGISFAFMQLCAGMMADRFNLRWVYAGAVLVWSAGGFFTGLADTITMLYICRIVLGIGESFNWVCATGIVGRIIPRESRSLANGIFHGGASVGAAVTPLLAAYMVHEDGKNWRTLFLVVGGMGLAWIALWLWLLRGGRGEAISHASASSSESVRAGGTERSFWHVFNLRTFWICLGFGIAVNLTWHFYRLWLPLLLQEERGMSYRNSQYVQIAFFLAADAGSLLAGWFTRRMVAGGYSVERSRQVMMFATSALCLLSWPAATSSNLNVAIPMLLLISMGAMGGFASFYSMTQEISGPHTSRCLGVIGFVIWVLIAIMQPQVGKLVDRIGTFVPVLIAAGFVPIIGSLLSFAWPSAPAEAPVVEEPEHAAV